MLLLHVGRLPVRPSAGQLALPRGARRAAIRRYQLCRYPAEHHPPEAERYLPPVRRLTRHDSAELLLMLFVAGLEVGLVAALRSAWSVQLSRLVVVVAIVAALLAVGVGSGLTERWAGQHGMGRAMPLAYLAGTSAGATLALFASAILNAVGHVYAGG